MNPQHIIERFGKPEHEHIGSSTCLVYPFGVLDWERYETLKYTLYLDAENTSENIQDFLSDLCELIEKHQKRGLIV